VKRILDELVRTDDEEEKMKIMFEEFRRKREE